MFRRHWLGLGIIKIEINSTRVKSLGLGMIKGGLIVFNVSFVQIGTSKYYWFKFILILELLNDASYLLAISNIKTSWFYGMYPINPSPLHFLPLHIRP